MLSLYNTQSRKVEPIVFQGDRFTMYVCGPTVYDKPHIGNARPVIVFDALRRTIAHILPEMMNLVHASNYTDIDDKILTRAQKRGITIEELCRETILDYEKAMRGLNVLTPTIRPRATEGVPKMIEMISRLIASGHAYVSEDHVLFDTTKSKPFFRENLADEQSRIETASYKRHPHDFVLWKPDWNGVGWDSPWGKGRMGWHIECSSMIHQHLGETIDLHGGGIDLKFPHHEAECQQSLAYTGKPLARHWMHNGMVMIDGRKMSKSDHNFITIEDVLARPQGGEALRMSMLMTHYRQPYDFTKRRLVDAQAILNGLRDRAKGPLTGNIDSSFLEALMQDFNTPLAIQRLANADPSSITKSLVLLGFAKPVDQLSVEEGTIFAQRHLARLKQDWAASDLLREQLSQLGIAVEDEGANTRWKRIREVVYELC